MSTHRGLTIGTCALLSSAAATAQTLAPVFTDHAVIQRGQPLRIWGTAAAGEAVRVSIAGRSGQAIADANGSWAVELPGVAAGGPHRLEARFGSGALAGVDDVLIGDVWLCSGQSNMEWPVSGSLNPDSELASADDPQLRLLTVPKRVALAPAPAFAEAVRWKIADKESVRPFSAACYFMARELRKTERIPIGLINASWGGTAIRSWIDPTSAARAAARDTRLLDLYRSDPAAAARQFGEQWQGWWNGLQKSRPWVESGGLRWLPMKTGYWEQWGDPAFADFNGMVWARSTVTLTAAEAAQAATLTLGVIDEIDQSWVNGVSVGNTYGWEVARSYVLPRGLLRAGANSIVVNVVDSYGAGGFQGPDSALALRLADGTIKPLAPRLEYALAPANVGTPPRPPWDTAAGLSIVYNGMIAPLGRLPLAGVAWYQGETDAGMADGYDQRLRAMMAGWRRQFGTPELPFLIVGLHNWGPPPVQPGASGWAEVRDAQRRVAVADQHLALVPAIDLGDPRELHPPMKQPVGQRLARSARALVYGADHPRSGPQPASVGRAGSGVVIRFTGVTGSLRSLSGAPLGFELCAARQDSCRFASASIEGAVVRLRGDGRPVSRIRYAWADAPVVNVQDEAGLPLSSFELPVP